MQERYLAQLTRGEIGGWAALAEACLKGWPDVAAEVVRQRPEIVGVDHLSKLHKSLSNLYYRGDSTGRAQVVRTLIAGGLDPTTPGLVAGGPLLLAAWLDGGDSINGSGPTDRLLHDAIEGRSLPDAALMLIDRGADLDARDAEGRTPLMLAARCGHVKIARALLDGRCDTLAVDHRGRSAFRHAVEAATGMGTHAPPTGAAKAKTIARLLADRSPAQPEDAVLAVLLEDDAKALSDWLASGLPAVAELAGSVGVHFGPEFTREQKLGFALREAGFSIERAKRMVRVEEPPADADAAARSSSLLYCAVALDAVRCATVLVEAGADPDHANGLGSTSRLLAKDWPRHKMVSLFDGRKVTLKDANAATRLERLGLDRDRLLKAAANAEAAGAKYESHWADFRKKHGFTPNDVQFGGDLHKAAHLLEDHERVTAAATTVLKAATGELARAAMEAHDELEWRYLHDAVLAGLAAAHALGKTSEFVGCLRTLPEILAPEPNSFVEQDAAAHAAWLCALLAKNQQPDPAQVNAIRSRRAVRAKRLLDVFEAIRQRDSAGVARSVAEVVKLHARGADANEERVTTQVIAEDATAMAVMAVYIGLKLDLRPTHRDRLLM